MAPKHQAPCVGIPTVSTFFVITIKKCPLEFTQKMSTRIHPNRGLLMEKKCPLEFTQKCPRKFTQIEDFSWTKVSTKIQMSTKICPFWKKVSTRSHCPRNVSIPPLSGLNKIHFFILNYRNNEKIPTPTICNTTGWGWTHPIFQERPSVLHLARIPIHNRHVHVISSQFYPDTIIQNLSK